MKTLTLLRHAKSSWSDRDQSDFDRPLNKRGKRDAPLMGRRLAERGLQPDLLLASPARRARLTVDAVAGELAVDTSRIIYDERLYLATLEALVTVVRSVAAELQHVMLVGHNPGLTELANYLVDGRLRNIPTSGAFSVELPIPTWQQLERGSASLLFYDYPKNNIT